MKKTGFTIIEVIVVFLLILGVTSLILPTTLNNTKHARLISKWTSTYSNLEYIFSVLKAQNNLEVYKKIDNAPSNEQRESMVLGVIKPYFRMKFNVLDEKYVTFYMNNLGVNVKDNYYFNKHYFTSEGSIIGLKWLVKKCTDKKTICGIMSVDINGLEKPNVWGEDIFGINIFSNRIEPIGKDRNINDLRQDCSNTGKGVFCSYYYLIGGKFD